LSFLYLFESFIYELWIFEGFSIGIDAEVVNSYIYSNSSARFWQRFSFSLDDGKSLSCLSSLDNYSFDFAFNWSMEFYRDFTYFGQDEFLSLKSS